MPRTARKFASHTMPPAVGALAVALLALHPRVGGAQQPPTYASISTVINGTVADCFRLAENAYQLDGYTLTSDGTTSSRWSVRGPDRAMVNCHLEPNGTTNVVIVVVGNSASASVSAERDRILREMKSPSGAYRQNPAPAPAYPAPAPAYPAQRYPAPAAPMATARGVFTGLGYSSASQPRVGVHATWVLKGGCGASWSSVTTSEALPPGLTLGPNAIVEGTPQLAGDWAMTITLHNAHCKTGPDRRNYPTVAVPFNLHIDG